MTYTEVLNQLNSTNPFGQGMNNQAEYFDLIKQAVKKQIAQRPERLYIKCDNPDLQRGNWMDVCPTCGAILVSRTTTSEISEPHQYNMSNRCRCGQLLERN